MSERTGLAVELCTCMAVPAIGRAGLFTDKRRVWCPWCDRSVTGISRVDAIRLWNSAMRGLRGLAPFLPSTEAIK